jgi:hypothetical protein
MNKLTLAMNVWRAYTVARHTEGSSLRGMIMGGVGPALLPARGAPRARPRIARVIRDDEDWRKVRKDT